MTTARRNRSIVLGLGLAVSLVVLALRAWLAPLEAVAMDLQMRLRGPRPPDPRVALVVIDDTSVDLYGRWPWPRTRVAEVVDRLAAAGASVIAFDVVFSEPSRRDEVVDLGAEDEALAAAIERSGRTVLGYFFRRRLPPGAPSVPPERLAGARFTRAIAPPGGYPGVPRRPGVETNLAGFIDAAAAQGFFNNEREQGVLRHFGLVVEHAGGYYPALPLVAVALALERPLALSPRAGGLPVIELGSERVRADERGALWLDYAGPSGTFPTYPVADLLAGRVPAEALAGRIVFFGATEVGIGDLFASPFGSEVPGVEVHANVADNLLAGRYIRDAGAQGAWSLLALLLIGPLAAFLVSAIERHLVGSLVAIAAVLVWPAVCYAAFRTLGWHLQMVPPVLAGGAALVLALRYQVGFVEARARQIRRTFQRYVSAAVVEEMLRHPERVELGGVRREMTVLFSDIRGFTTLAESLDSEQVVRLLNEFFTPMTRLVLAAGGTLDKYMGDALMAFFGAPVEQPDHAGRACAAALAMRAELARLNAAWRAAGRFPEGAGLGIGIGLNSGPMSVGNMGSDQIFDYTVIGDEVNLGSRIEGLNKNYASEVLVSGATAAAAGDFVFRQLDRVRVKGKHEAVALYELLARRPAPEAEARAAAFAAALASYRGRDFAGAERAFAALAAEPGGDGPAGVFRDRCRRYATAPPPPDWDAVETLTSK